jgi:Fe-S-cluster containining protein
VHLPSDYPALLTRLDDWQSSVRERFPGVVPCRAGCSACCHGPFDISVADALLVRDAVAALPGGQRESVRRRARAQLSRMAGAEPSFRFPWDVSRLGEARFDALVEAHADAPCPALGSGGECLIYESRPMVCRMMGLGMRSRSGAVLENACPIQEDFPEFRDLPPQEFDLEAWEAEETTALPLAAVELFADEECSGYETTIAGAALLNGA